MTSAPDEDMSAPAAPKVDLALCVDPRSLLRFRAVLRYLCVGLLDVAAQVRLVTSSPEAKSLVLGSVQHILCKEPRWPLYRNRLATLLHALDARTPNIVHGFSARSYEMAAAVARHFNAHLILHALSMDDADRLARTSQVEVDQIIAGSKPILDAILDPGTINPSTARIARPGILTGDGPTCFTHPERVPTILCTSQLIRVNGVDRLLEALASLRNQGHEFMAFFTGSGPMEPALRKRARTLDLAAVVTFSEPSGDAKQIMAGADIFVRPAPEDALSVRTLQAMGSGMAVITIEGGASDAYVHEHTGLICPDGQADTLATAIERLLNDHPFARKLASQAVGHVKQNHSVSAMCETAVQIYHDLVLRNQTLSVR
ncbi:MAG: glycosyltransferase family 4 protein [bacterium]|nr:glycosyltransferase family 4 protein [bacterium]